MRGRYIVATALAGGALFATQATGFAEETATSTPTTTTTPTSKNEPYPFLAISLAPAKPGGDVLVSVGCPAGDLGKVESRALDIGPFEVAVEQPKLIVNAVGHVRKGLSTGFYRVDAVCGKVSLHTNFQVIGAPPKPTTPPPTATKKPKPRTGNQVSRIPVGAPQTGGGGTAH